MAMGIGKYAGKANLISAVKIFDKSLRKQGTKHNYHPIQCRDSFALSLLITEITGLPASDNLCFFPKYLQDNFRQRGRYIGYLIKMDTPFLRQDW